MHERVNVSLYLWRSDPCYANKRPTKMMCLAKGKQNETRQQQKEEGGVVEGRQHACKITMGRKRPQCSFTGLAGTSTASKDTAECDRVKMLHFRKRAHGVFFDLFLFPVFLHFSFYALLFCFSFFQGNIMGD